MIRRIRGTFILGKSNQSKEAKLLPRQMVLIKHAQKHDLPDCIPEHSEIFLFHKPFWAGIRLLYFLGRVCLTSAHKASFQGKPSFYQGKLALKAWPKTMPKNYKSLLKSSERGIVSGFFHNCCGNQLFYPNCCSFP